MKIVTEAIVLHSLPFQDHDQILTLFSQELGLLKVFVKGGRARHRNRIAALSPITRVEAILTRKNSELYSCLELSVLNAYLKIRDNGEALDAACQIVKALLGTQSPERAAPELYTMLVKYLEQLQESPPSPLLLSFKLKILKYEGLIQQESLCTHCHANLNEAYINNGEIFCKIHAPHPSIGLTLSETNAFFQLLLCRSSKALKEIPLPNSLKQKITDIFDFCCAQ